MTTSGSTNFSLNGDQIITAALRVLRVIDAGGTAPAGDITTGRQALNLMLKSWAGLKDIDLWLTQEACLFLEYDEQKYTLGPSGDYCGVLSDCVKTQLAADSAATDTTLTVDSITGISNGDYIGVELDDGTLEWTTVNGAPSGTTVTITTGVTSAASTDNWIFAFTTKITRPMELLEARIRDTDDNDQHLTIVKNREDFFGWITDVTSRGETTHLWYDPVPTNGRIYTWPVADDVTKRLIFTMRRTVEDFDAASDDFDGPPELINALKWNLAVDLAPEYGRDLNQLVIAKAVESFTDVERKYRERKTIRFYP